jgi:hypothetical protein
MTDAVLERPKPEINLNLIEEREALEVYTPPERLEPDPQEPLGRAFRSFGRKATAGVTALALVGSGAEASLAYGDGEQALPAPVVTVVTHSASSSMSDAINKKVIFGEDEHLSIKHVNPATCRKFKTFKNSMDTIHGRVWFIDHNGTLCRTPDTSSGWIKRGGGKSGRDCRNEAAPMNVPTPPLVKARIINVTNFNMKINVHALAYAKVNANCPNSAAEGIARAEVVQAIRLRRFLKMSGAAKSHFGFTLVDKASAKASASAQCSETTTTTTTPTPPPPVTPPPPKQNRPPQVMILNKPAHDIDTDQIQICAVKSDADNDKLFDTWTAQIGNVSSEFMPDPTNAPDKVCVEYTPPDVPAGTQEEETVKISVSDGLASASDQASFPVVDDNFKPFRTANLSQSPEV